MSDSFDHLQSIWYQSEPLEVPYCPKQFLGLDLFSYSKQALVSFMKGFYCLSQLFSYALYLKFVNWCKHKHNQSISRIFWRLFAICPNCAVAARAHAAQQLYQKPAYSWAQCPVAFTANTAEVARKRYSCSEKCRSIGPSTIALLSPATVGLRHFD